MNRADARKALLQHWMAQWHTKVGGTQAAPTVPYAIDNRRPTSTAATFAIVEVTGVSSDQVTMGAAGARRFERTGWIDVRLYGPRDQGAGALDQLAQYVTEIFEATQIGAIGEHRGITTYATAVTEARNDREFPEHWCVLCRTGWEFHERR